jgi:hypothetical protein
MRGVGHDSASLAGGDSASLAGPTAKRALLAHATTLDPLAYVLDIGPPGTGLGCSWHRPRC